MKARLFCALSILASCVLITTPQPSVAQQGPAGTPNPLRNAYFGDLHVHTSWSPDAFVSGVRVGPEDAYRFAKGEAIDHISGQKRLRRHRFERLVEPLRDEPSFLVKSTFGCLSCYAHGRLMLVLADRRPPWHGLLVPTRREHQAALRAEIRALGVHPVLGKWLHLREDAEGFEEGAARLVALACADDPRLGVDPTPRRRGATRTRVRSRRAPVSRST